MSPEPSRLLIVDDDPELLRFLMEELSEAGHHCTGCDNGQDALLSLRQESFDLVVMDFLQRASAANRCLLALPSAQWVDSGLCPGADLQHLKAGLSDALAWQLSSWQPQDFASGTLQWRWPDGSLAKLELVLPQ